MTSSHVHRHAVDTRRRHLKIRTVHNYHVPGVGLGHWLDSIWLMHERHAASANCARYVSATSALAPVNLKLALPAGSSVRDGELELSSGWVSKAGGQGGWAVPSSLACVVVWVAGMW
jgi:hypothetical protein